jgi:hypothetical protein
VCMYSEEIWFGVARGNDIIMFAFFLVLASYMWPLILRLPNHRVPKDDIR